MKSKITPRLRTIYGGFEGCLLVLRSTGSMDVEEAATGNIKLEVSPRILSSPQDTLTLLNRGPDWVEVAYSDNG